MKNEGRLLHKIVLCLYISAAVWMCGTACVVLQKISFVVRKIFIRLIVFVYRVKNTNHLLKAL
jgi:hypothetical protein